MRKKYTNIEDLLDAFISVLKNNFNTSMKAYNDQRNIDKGTDIEVRDVEDSDYYETLDLNITSGAFMLYGLSGVTPQQTGQGGHDLQKPSTELHFIYAYETAGEIQQSRKMTRVQEVLESLMANEANDLIRNDYQITRTDPLTIEDDSGNYLKACGLIVTVDV